MNIRAKTLSAVGVAFLLLAAGLAATTELMVQRSFARLEEHRVRRAVERVSKALDTELERLGHLAGALAGNHGPALPALHALPFATRGTGQALLQGHDLDCLLLYDADGALVRGWGRDTAAQDRDPGAGAPPAGAVAHLSPLASGLLAAGPARGPAALPGGVLLTATHPIALPEGGLLAAGRFLDADLHAALSQLTGAHFTLKPWSAAPDPGLDLAEQGVLVRVRGASHAAGYARLEGLAGAGPGFLLGVTMPRDIYEVGRETQFWVLGWMLAVGVGMLLLVAALMERLVLGRVRRLDREVAAVEAAGDPAARLEATGADELGDLAGGINDMLASLEASQAEVRLAHERLQILLGSISVVLITLDRRDRVARWNRSAEQVLGVPEPAVLDRPLHESGVVWEWERVLEAAWTCREHGAAVRLEDVSFRRADGRNGLLQMTVNPVLDDEGQRTGVLILAEDVTHRKERELRLGHELKMQSIGRLAAGVAHEINTPVQYIDYNVGFLQESFGELLALLDVGVRLGQAVRDGLGDGVLLALAEELHQAAAEHDLDYLRREVPASLANCLTGIAQVGGIVRGMRRFSHPGEGRPSAVDVNRCLEHTIAVSRNEWKNAAVLEFTPQPDLPAVQGWPGDLTQAFLNLLLNAAQALEEESAQGRQGRGRILVSTRLDRDRVEVVVQDNGPGISPELQSRVFEPFFTTKPPGRGTGQGLAVVHAVVVEKHGGEVRLESEPGRGARFVVRLPLDRADSAES